MARGVKRKAANRGRAAKEKPEPEEQQNEPGQSSSQPPEENNSQERAASAEPEPEPQKEPEPEPQKEPEPKPQKEPEPEPQKEPEPEPQKELEQDPEPSHKEAAGRRRKRAKVLKTETETEYFPEKRNLEDLWQQTFPVGTEWDQLDIVYQYKWNFSNLEDAFETGGLLHDKKVYLFGCTEAQMVSFQGRDKVILIPVVVAVVSPFPPSDKIGIKSVQRETEEIIPMKQMKMDWVPYIPLEKRETMVERLKESQIFILSCVQRRAGLKHLKVERVKKFEYCLPYFYHPLHEDELEQSTVVDLLFPIDPKPVFCEFDWELDVIEEFTDKLIEEEELPADQKEPFKEFLKEKVREAKKANREARDTRKKALEEMNNETKTALENMRFYKFYPVTTPNTPDVSKFKSPFINRYYGKAHGVI